MMYKLQSSSVKSSCGENQVATSGMRTATPKRADARQNIASILDAATKCLAQDPGASINEIAQAAGVGRVTLYGHFPSRASLVSHVVDRAMKHTEDALETIDVEGDPRDALARLLDASWLLTHRYGALVVAANQALSTDQIHTAHQQPVRRMQRLLRRGRRAGVFRVDMPLHWQVAMIQSIVHGASSALHRGEITERQAPRLVRETVLAAMAAVSEK